MRGSFEAERDRDPAMEEPLEGDDSGLYVEYLENQLTLARAERDAARQELRAEHGLRVHMDSEYRAMKAERDAARRAICEARTLANAATSYAEQAAEALREGNHQVGYEHTECAATAANDAWLLLDTALAPEPAAEGGAE